MSAKISAVICTRNRAHLLKMAIESLLEQTLAKEHYEIMVVDNGSTDNTKEMVAKYSNVRYTHEEVMGISHARNCAIKEAKAPFVAFLDDDARACSKWLEKILQTIEQVDPSPQMLGGKIFPHFEHDPPAWMSPALYPFIALIDYGDQSGWLADDKSLYTANIAFNREAVQQLGGFHTELGYKYLTPKEKSLLVSGEDIWMQKMWRQTGKKIYYEPQISVTHFIPKSRLSKSWFIRKLYGCGIESTMFGLLNGESRIALFAKSFVRLVQAIIIFLASAAFLSTPKRFYRQLLVVFHYGRLSKVFSFR